MTSHPHHSDLTSSHSHIISNSSSSSSSSLSPTRPRLVTLLRLVTLIFFCTSGGAYGSESAVAAAPPLVLAAMFLILPWVWSLPVALITAELASAFPDEGGGAIEWVIHAAGSKMGRQAGFWYWAACMTDNSMYSVLFSDYMASAFGIELPWVWRLALSWAMLALETLINFHGIIAVANYSTAAALVAVVPLLVLAALCAPYLEVGLLLNTTGRSTEWHTALAVLIWQFSGFDDCGSLVSHVQDPERTYPRAMVITICVVICVNLFPVITAVCVDQEWSHWREGHLANIALTVGGPALRCAVVVGGLVALFSNLNVLLLITANSIQYMAKQRWLFWSDALAAENEHGTPQMAILFSACFSGSLVFFSFPVLAEIHTVLYCFMIGIEVVVFLYLRVSQPQLSRPYRVPGGLTAAVLMILFPLGVVLTNIYFSAHSTKYMVALLSAAMAVVHLRPIASVHGLLPLPLVDPDEPTESNRTTSPRSIQRAEL
eukprot:gnl/Spiro4/22588_TR11141_c0_g1_i1.p1 gnl/Spiro4/22588_TR11141_c0_g1~~gnl/Spiro4/22588_TR11141_c0_g1_i1.p1  ORF type:complete len:512 (-),score=89.93 gnl/Spiro4/22588_TR11141_c0_g1_i1:37-1500(-)